MPARPSIRPSCPPPRTPSVVMPSEYHLQAGEERVLNAQRPGRRLAQQHRPVEPGMLPVKLAAHPAVQIPVEAERYFARALAESGRVGQPAGADGEDVVGQLQAREPKDR